MAKKSNQKTDILENSMSEDEVFLEDEKMKKEEVKQEEVKEPTIGFEQAFRIYKKQNPLAAKWTIESVAIFAKKKLNKKSATLQEWIETFNKY